MCGQVHPEVQSFPSVGGDMTMSIQDPLGLDGLGQPLHDLENEYRRRRVDAKEAHEHNLLERAQGWSMVPRCIRPSRLEVVLERTDYSNLRQIR